MICYSDLRLKLLLLSLFLFIGFSGVAKKVEVSLPPGFYEDPVSVAILTKLPAATVIYTLDSSWPKIGKSNDYLEPLNFSKTTILRVMAFNASDTTKVYTFSYIFWKDVIHQPDSLSIYPEDSGMDPRVVNDPIYKDKLLEGLKGIASISICLPEEDFIGVESGIYYNFKKRKRAWERLSSFELFMPDGSYYQDNCGLRIHGGGGRRLDKKSFRVYFRDEYGKKKLRHEIFENADSTIDVLVLRGRTGDGWLNPDNDDRGTSQMLRDQFARDVYGSMGNAVSHGRAAHLYINGKYWGLYNVVEYLNESFFESYHQNEGSKFEIWSHWDHKSGKPKTWPALHKYLKKTPHSRINYDSLFTTIDIKNLIDYMLVNLYGATGDWIEHNYIVAKSYSDAGKWRFYVWDAEYFLSSGNLISLSNTNKSPGKLFHLFLRHPDFKMLFLDRVCCHTKDGGSLSPAFLDSAWMAAYYKFSSAIVAESARWGDNQRPDKPYTLFEEYLTEQSRLREEYFPERTSIFLNQLKEAGLYDDNLLPVERLDKCKKSRKRHHIILKNPNIAGELYFTLDGTDPRSPGGGISEKAKIYSRKKINPDLPIRARIHHQGQWSPECY